MARRGTREGQTKGRDCAPLSAHGAATRGVYGDHCGVRTGMAWSSLVCWLFVLVCAGSLEPGAPPRAASGLVLARVAGGMRIIVGVRSRVLGESWVRVFKDQLHFDGYSLKPRNRPGGGSQRLDPFVLPRAPRA